MEECKRKKIEMLSYITGGGKRSKTCVLLGNRKIFI